MAKPDIGDTYRPLTGLIYVFNLIVGTGALTMPAAFAKAGWMLSIIIVVALCLMSFVTVTFVIEAMSLANAVMKSENSRRSSRTSLPSMPSTVKERGKPVVYMNSDVAILETESFPSTSFGVHEKEPLIPGSGISNGDNSFHDRSPAFDITYRVEMGKMATMFFPKVAVRLFYFCIAVYLYGDLAIYAAAIGKSLRDVTCTWDHPCNATLTPSDPCWEGIATRGGSYCIFVILVLLTLGPFAFFNVQKTKYLQMLTTLFRWFSFTTMIILAATALFEGKGQGHPPAARITGIPNLFGVCVYSFMCHHSLPSLITPINKKKNIYWLIFSDYVLILVFYALLCFTGVFAFQKLNDIYTLNFQKCSSGSSGIVPSVEFLEYFLPMFPVFTLSASFPIIAITLCNNLKSLLLPLISSVASPLRTFDESPSPRLFFIDRIFFPLIAVVPPCLLALTTENLQVLVGVVGSYAGTSIQYIIPALLVYYGRNNVAKVFEDEEELFGEGIRIRNRFRSPFRHKYWVYFVLLWSGICILFVTIDHILEWTSGEVADAE